MPDPAAIHLIPGAPQFLMFAVTSNGVLPDGTNPGTPDTTTPLTCQFLQGGPADTNAVLVSETLVGTSRKVTFTNGPIAPGSGQKPWSVRISAAGRLHNVLVTGDSQALADISGVFWDGTQAQPVT